MLKEKVIKAYEYSQEKHKGQIRKFTDLPYFTHPKGVARILEQLTGDEDLVIVGLLHDVVEDTDATLGEIKELFGPKIATLVEELTSDKPKDMDKGLYLAGKMIKMTPDALTVKLADRLHNVMYLEGDNVHLSFIKKYYKETKTILSILKEHILFDHVQDLMVRRIEIVLDFLQVRYDL